MEEIYDRYAESSVFTHNKEDAFFKLAERYFLNYYLSFFPNDKDSNILEIGCGQGRFVKLIHDRGYRSVYGIDVSADQIAYGKGRLCLGNYLSQADALEFLSRAESSSYDVILLLDVLEHLPLDYSITLLKEVHRALRVKGKILVQAPNGLAPLLPQFYGDVTHQRCYTPYSLEQSFILAGFSDVTCYAQPPLVHGLKSLIRRALWSGLINPFIKFYMLVASGTSMGGIYTPNIYAVACKS